METLRACRTEFTISSVIMSKNTSTEPTNTRATCNKGVQPTIAT